MANHQDYIARKSRNEESRNRADKDRELWTSDEVEMLLEFFPPDSDAQELIDLAAVLGRTVEACRQKRYEVLRDEAAKPVAKKLRELGTWSGGFTSLDDMGY